ncbi:hypothetical protein PseudUWO311_04095 [Pseudanabaena sp. UWO311]|uniref:hypothetical protein n=1 Tax=Pseudanabaena sp. UWO311 TaxID=2487337 RepID=UPI001159A3F8|nr:hypothetical protein [Pseudanabaena sp. UWO311]TYQ28680.1 hypothetical protein PseudUWO311_04095 [Pseudanabaena sp. UWO311]
MRLNLRNLFLLLITSSSISSVMLSPHAAIAQVADVPNPDSNGDFRSAFQRGNRGFYTISKWLVIQPMGSGVEDYALNCRYTPNGQIRSRIQRGAIITAVFKGTPNLHRAEPPEPSSDAIALDSDGTPWLRVKGSQNELAYPAKPANFDQLGECYVRATLKYIAPINPDSLMAYSSNTYCKELPLYCQPKLLKWLSLGYTP